MVDAKKTKKNIVFFHPDLGIGGAERLVVDAAVGLQNLDHKVTIFTSHCDPSHCFDEARDGTLDVRVRGNTLIPPSILSRFSIVCAILRQLHLILQITAFSSELRDLQPDAFFIDQLSAGIPLLRILCPHPRILFYCHFPDKLLATRGSLIKQLYRIPFDWLESWTTGTSDVIVVNSKFTREIFADAFPGLKHRNPAVVYPCVDVGREEDGLAEGGGSQQLWQGKEVILSINRFERKKNVDLAIRAFAGLPEASRQRTRLVIAGGYDPRVSENAQTHTHLQSLASSLSLPHATSTSLITALSIPSHISILFLLSVPSSLKATLLRGASLLVYTPPWEHFGIVPLEAMHAGLPVLAADQGGPRESVVDGVTGWLRGAEDVEAWAEVMEGVVSGTVGERKLGEMGREGRKRVERLFSKEEMGRRFDAVVEEMLRAERTRSVVGMVGVGGVLLAVGVACAALLALWYRR